MKQVTFEAVIGIGYKSDIAIDDVTLTTADCGVSTQNPNTQPPTTTRAPTTQFPTTRSTTIQTSTGTSPTAGPTVFSCTFEPNTNCFLHDVVGRDDYNWSIQKGRTPSDGTGPVSAAEGKFYAYMEQSGYPKAKGDQAILESLTIPMPTGSVCLTYSYHMYGYHMGSLEVVFGNVTYFYQAESRNHWRKAKITLKSTNYPMDYKIQIIGTRGNGYQGDIAIDDVWVTDGQCVLNCSDHPCGKNSVCIPDTSKGFKCECVTGFTGLDCETVTGQVNCTFEDGDFCFLEDSMADDFDWTINTGPTSSDRTGPSSASEGSRYAYIEVSGKMYGVVAALESKINVEAGMRCLVFDYNMYGYHTGTLRVLKKSRNGTTMNLFTRSGQQSISSTDWKTAAVDLFHLTLDRLVFEASRGKTFRGDIAIDNIRYIPGKCGCNTTPCLHGGSCVDTGIGIKCTCPPLFTGARCEAKFVCTFDGNMRPCFLANVINDDMDWTFISGNTLSKNTGPSHLLDGAYAYTEASSMAEGSKAVLSSEYLTLRTPGPSCLSFYYNMYGIAMGTLNVWAGDRIAKKKVWTLSGDQGDVWNHVTVDIPSSNDLVIQIEGSIGRNFMSDMAIDSVRLFDTPCSGPVESTTPPKTTAAPTVLRCTFEPNTDCFLKDVQGSGNCNWTIHSGGTPSYYTGPDVAAEGSYFAYMEASGKPQGAQAIMESQAIQMSSGSVCLTFAYHMYGRDIDSLEVLYGNQPYFNEVGDKGNIWMRAQVTITGNGYPAKIQFKATRGQGFRGDIAVDDIQVTDGRCGPVESTTPPKTTAAPTVLRCTFEPNTDCFLKDVQGSGNCNWTIHSGGTPSYYTGPDVAAEGSYFAYMEATGKPQGAQAIMESQAIQMSSGSACLTFAYHMYGRDIDSLEVLYGNQPYFNEVGDKGNIWIRAQVTITGNGYPAKIQFKATRGQGFRGDIAVDDIQVTDGRCASTT
ncbi:MAM and LDL-receptor class A domain-containing protein 1-like [Crassostrea virginica]